MKEFYKTIVFTKVPLDGYYRYKDIFQIYPANLVGQPELLPQSHFPIILEFWLSDEEIISVSYDDDIEFNELLTTAAAQLNKQDKILDLLSAFTNNRFFRYNITAGKWGIPISSDNSDKKSSDWSSKWYIPWYTFPELKEQLKIDSFSKHSLQELKKIQYLNYYTYDPNLDFDAERTITLPSAIDELFDAYFSLDSEIIQFIDTAISYLIASMDFYDNRKTLSLISAFTSLETMVNLEFKDLELEKCNSCGQLRYSISRKFRDYLLNYIGNSKENKQKFNSYYSLRSKIIHTGKQLKTEKLFTQVPKDEHGEDILKRVEVLQMARISLANWLLMNTE